MKLALLGVMSLDPGLLGLLLLGVLHAAHVLSSLWRVGVVRVALALLQAGMLHVRTLVLIVVQTVLLRLRAKSNCLLLPQRWDADRSRAGDVVSFAFAAAGQAPEWENPE